LNINGADADAWASLASCYLRMGKCERAVESIERAISIRSKATYFKLAAIIYDADANHTECGRAAQRAYELGKQDSITLTLLGKSHIQLGRLQEAQACLGEAVKLNPGNLNARYYFGMVLKSSGQNDSARQQLEEILWSKTETPLKTRARDEMKSLI
jgi:tetratricopeptide (TPR) repeat protein